jgi:hypothetical protein
MFLIAHLGWLPIIFQACCFVIYSAPISPAT